MCKDVLQFHDILILTRFVTFCIEVFRNANHNQGWCTEVNVEFYYYPRSWSTNFLMYMQWTLFIKKTITLSKNIGLVPCCSFDPVPLFIDPPIEHAIMVPFQPHPSKIGTRDSLEASLSFVASEITNVKEMCSSGL